MFSIPIVPRMSLLKLYTVCQSHVVYDGTRVVGSATITATARTRVPA